MSTGAYQISGDSASAPANVDLSASQYCGVDVNSSGKVILPTGAGGKIVGVLQNDPSAADQAAEFKMHGVTKMKLGGTVSVGDLVKVDSSGRAVTASASDAAAGTALGVCLVGGAVNNIGTVLLAVHAAGALQATGDETVTTGALSVNTEISYVSVTGTKAFSLADGKYTGQRKRVECTVAGSTPVGTLTLATAFGSQPTTHVFRAVGQALELVWTATGWKVIGKTRVGELEVVVGTTVLTGEDMVARYNLSVTGTVTASGANAIPAGLVAGEPLDVQVTTAASIPDGEIDITATTLDNAAATKIDDINGTTSHHARFIWDGAAWQNVSLTGLTLA